MSIITLSFYSHASLQVKGWLHKQEEGAEQGDGPHLSAHAIETLKAAVNRLELYESHVNDIVKHWEKAKMDMGPVFSDLQALQSEPNSKMRFDRLRKLYTRFQNEFSNYKVDVRGIYVVERNANSSQMEELRVKLEILKSR